MTDLELVSTDELTDELRRRTDCGIVALGRKNPKGHGDLCGSYTWWGGLHVALGMAYDAAFRIVSSIKLIKDTDDGDSELNSTF